MQYQYLGSYENYQLQCPKCNEVFLARGVHSSAPSNRGNGFGWHFDPYRQDFGFTNQPAGPAFNGAHNAFMNGGLGEFNLFPNEASRAAFFSSAAAAAAAQSKMAAAAAAAAFSAVPSNNLGPDFAHDFSDNLNRERVEAERELKRKERSREAMGRSMVKQKDGEMAKDAGKGEVDAQAVGRTHKRKKQDVGLEDDDDNLENNDQEVYEQRMSMQDDRSSLGRRSSGSKRNVTAYEVNFSGDPDLDDFPGAKRGKFEGGAEDAVKPEEEEEEVCRKQSDNSMKKNRCDQDSKLDGGPGATHKLNGGKPLQQVESPSAGLKTTHRLSHRDFENQNLPSKSGSTLRTSTKLSQEHLGSNSAFFGKDRVVHRSIPSPSKSLASISSEPDAEEDSEGLETESDVQDSDVQEILVPDPDFHDFDYSRTEMDVREGQIWAIYDDQDGMPRFYGRISLVYSKPFKAHINWLEHSALSDNEIAWSKSTGLVLACGEFQIGRTTVMDHIETFSHIIMKTSGQGMLINIYPKKDQVWAIHRDGDAEQRIGPARIARSNGSPYTYDMVEILSEFSNGCSLKAVVLFKISGFKTVFSRQKDVEEFRYFKISELDKFSHNVPCQRIDDVEAERCGIPRGALELDPASAPLDLILSPSDPSE